MYRRHPAEHEHTKNDGEPIILMQYVPYNGSAVWEEWWKRSPGRKRLLVSLGTVKPIVDGLDLISWVMDSAREVDAEIILNLPANARSDLRCLPSNVRLVGWIPMGFSSMVLTALSTTVMLVTP